MKSLQEFAVRPPGAECGCPGACGNAESLAVRRVRLFCQPTSRIAVRRRAKPAPSISLLPDMAGCPRRLGAMRTPSLLFTMLVCRRGRSTAAPPSRSSSLPGAAAEPRARARTAPAAHHSRLRPWPLGGQTCKVCFTCLSLVMRFSFGLPCHCIVRYCPRSFDYVFVCGCTGRIHAFAVIFCVCFLPCLP